MSTSHNATSPDDIELHSARGKGENVNAGKQSNGCYVTRIRGVFLVCLSVSLSAVVGVIVYFAAPQGMVCLSESTAIVTDTTWSQCEHLAAQRNMCISKHNCPEKVDVLPTIKPDALPSIRLPLKVNPLHYNLELTPDIYSDDPINFTLRGHVLINIKCAVSTDVITLHINKLDIDGNIKLLDSGPSSNSPNVEKWDINADGQFLRIYLSEQLTVDQSYILDIHFHGPIKNDLIGLYWSSYTSGGKIKYLATTQMQPTDARKSFPCFDEPGVKATYDIRLVRKSNMTSLSNMNRIRIEHRADGWEVDVYNTTVKMSTYLLAFFVSEFQYTESFTTSGTRVRVWSRPEAVQQTEYAVDIATRTINFFESYFAITYPLPKQDFVAVPDFMIGAMENWGLIMFRESLILYDREMSSATDQQRLVEIVVHELAHQWFGNLVTPEWWDDLWLNEGFASYMEYIGMEHLMPDWKMHDQFVVRDLHESFLIDSLSTSHPIYVPVNHPDEINEIFDKISYLKGASVIRMMHFVLGDEIFTSGLSNYLKAYEYSNANHNNLWEYLTVQAKNSNRSLNVSEIMNSWIGQMGYPVVTITTQGNAAQLTQERFLSDPDQSSSDKYTSPYEYKWNIPVTYILSTDQQSVWQNPPVTWMWRNESTKEMNGVSSAAKWLIGNVGQYGYYRVNYDVTNWDALIQQLNEDHTKISIKNRAQIIDDAINLGRSGYVDQLIGLRTTEYLNLETNYVPWKSAIDGLGYLNNMLKYTKYYGAFKNYMLKKLSPLYDALGFEYNRTTEPHLQRYKRTLITEETCYYGHQPCHDEALTIFRQWMRNPESSTLKADLRSTVYCHAISSGGAEEWDFLFQYYKYTNLAAEARSILKALACSKESWILNRYLEYVLDGDTIRQQDGTTVMTEVSKNTIGGPLTWDFTRAHWPVIRERWGGGFGRFAKFLRILTTPFNTEFQLQQLLDFKAQYPDMGAGSRALDQAIETTRQNAKWIKDNLDTIGEWLQANT